MSALAPVWIWLYHYPYIRLEQDSLLEAKIWEENLDDSPPGGTCTLIWLRSLYIRQPLKDCLSHFGLQYTPNN